MIFFIPIQMQLRSVGSVGSFNAPDPWNEGEPSVFTLEELQMSHPPSRWGKPKPPKRQAGWLAGRSFYGIKSEIDGELRLLPEFLRELWLLKKIPAEALPALFHAAQPQLKDDDFKLFLHSSRLTAGILFGTFGLLAAVFLALYVIKALPAKEGRKPSAVVQMSVPEWQQRAFEPGDAYMATGGEEVLAVTSRAEWRTPVQLPKGVSTYRSVADGYRLGWTPAGAQDRLLLLSEVRRYDLDHGGRVGYFYGLVFLPEDVGIPAALLTELKQTNPNLDTGLVFCEEWGWARAGMQAGMFLHAAVGCLALGSILTLAVWIGFYPKQRRRRRQMAETLLQLQNRSL